MAGFSGTRDRSVSWARRRSSELELSGMKVAVVGGTNGLGRALSRVMAERGASVIVVGRTPRDQNVPNIELVAADLERMREAARIGRTLPADLDLVVLTTGIMAARERQVTAEGLERDMAVSYLSRLAIVRELAPRLRAGARVFVMGFPGTGQAGTDLDDLNADRRYDSWAVHMNTVAGNEALVLDGAKRHPELRFFGLNPGLIRTGIRANALGEGTLRFKIVEGLIGFFMTSAETYAERTAPLLFAPELEERTGVMFNQKGHAIVPTKALDAARVKAIIDASEALVARAVSETAASSRA